MKRAVPLNIIVIAILAFFSGIYMVAAGIIEGRALRNDTGDLSDLFRLMWSICFVVTVILSVLLAFIAWGLLTGKQWARIVTIIICFTAIIVFILSYKEIDIRMIIAFIIYSAIAGYLLFSKKARSHFHKKRAKR